MPTNRFNGPRYNHTTDPNGQYGGWDPRSPAGKNFATQYAKGWTNNPLLAPIEGVQGTGVTPSGPTVGSRPGPSNQGFLDDVRRNPNQYPQVDTGFYVGGMPTGGPQPQVMPGIGGLAGGYNGGIQNVQQPAPLGGSTPLVDAMLQGYGMGLAPFNTQFYNQLGSSLFNQATQNYNENIKPGMNSQAITAGGYGGDRSKIAEGVMMDRMNQSVFNSLIPQVTSGYENWLNRGVNTGQAAGQNLLGMGALDISAYNAQNQAAQGAANAAGVQSYTNPWATGIGTAISMWPFINSMFGSPTTTKPT